MGNETERTRLALNLYLNNPEHKRVYDILQKQNNKNAYIRDAIIYYNQGFQNEAATKAEIQQMIRETMQEIVTPVLESLKEKQDHSINVDGYKNAF